MDEQKKPRSRVKKVVGEGKDFDIKGEGLGTGPVNQAQRLQQPHSSFTQPQRPQQQPQQPHQAQTPFTQPQSQQQPQRPQQPQTPFTQPQRPSDSGPQKQYHSAVKQNTARSGGVKQSSPAPQRTSGGVKQSGPASQRAASGGSGKLLLIVVALVVLLGGGGLSGLFGGGDSGNNTLLTATDTQTGTSSSSGSGLGDISNLLSSLMGSGSSSTYDLSSLLGGLSGSSSSSSSSGSLSSLISGSGTSSSSSGSLSSLVSGSGSIESLLSESLGSSQTAQTFPSSSSSGGNTALDETVSKKARDKYTTLRGNNRDTVTLLVYMCGTDLESQQGMATADLKEMANATVSDKINLLVYTGGCSRWRNNVISSSVNQIYRISDGKFECLEKNAGSGSMVNPETLVSFIEYGKKNYAADRMCLIFWDHGGGSVSGYGYDEKVGRGQSMTLAGINSALKKADVKFDFIGFDACLMATVENGLMLSQYADYLIASEETEPGVGWYYTNWLTQLGKNTSMPTLQLGKLIADDFVAVCERQCRGQATTLSVVDLAELSATIPNELKEFSVETNELIQNKEYKKISTARSKTREFAQSSKIDQIDLVDFANRIGSSESKDLAKALKGAVKYNRTGGGITNAYGLSIYFPYKRAGKVNQMVSTYQAIGMDEEYTRCIQEFASLEVSGQVAAGTALSGSEAALSGYDAFLSGSALSGTALSGTAAAQTAPASLLNSLLGQGGGYPSSYSASGLEDLLGGLYGGGSAGGATGSILDLFLGRSLTAESAAEYILENHFDASRLVWQNGRIELSQSDWDNTVSVVKNVFVDNGSGFIDLGCDEQFEREGNALIDDFEGTWLSLDGNVMPYYSLGTIEYDNDVFVMYGYAPALLNGERVNLIIAFINGEEGCISGAQYVYTGGQGGEDGPQAKITIAPGQGDRIQFLCDYYDYEGSYRDSYKLGEEFTLGSAYELADSRFSKNFRVTYCFTDIYQQKYWTPAITMNNAQ